MDDDLEAELNKVSRMDTATALDYLLRTFNSLPGIVDDKYGKSAQNGTNVSGSGEQIAEEMGTLDSYIFRAPYPGCDYGKKSEQQPDHLRNLVLNAGNALSPAWEELSVRASLFWDAHKRKVVRASLVAYTAFAIGMVFYGPSCGDKSSNVASASTSVAADVRQEATPVRSAETTGGAHVAYSCRREKYSSVARRMLGSASYAKMLISYNRMHNIGFIEHHDGRCRGYFLVPYDIYMQAYKQKHYKKNKHLRKKSKRR